MGSFDFRVGILTRRVSAKWFGHCDERLANNLRQENDAVEAVEVEGGGVGFVGAWAGGGDVAGEVGPGGEDVGFVLHAIGATGDGGPDEGYL